MDRQIFKTSILKPIKPLKPSQVAHRVFNSVSSNSTCFNRMDSNNKSKKIENDIQIKRSFPNSKNFDHWFETEEEIQTEQQCNKIRNQNNSQKRNNSFSKSSTSKVRDVASIFSSTSTNKKKQLSFFHCDTLAIRPNPHTFNVSIDCQKSKQEKQEQKQYQSPKKKQKRIFGQEISISKNEINEQSFSERVEGYEVKSSVRHLKPSSMKKHKRIFEHVKKQSEQELPYALRTQQDQKQRRMRQIFQSNDEFHIIIDTDQITQCCF